jgi:integrase
VEVDTVTGVRTYHHYGAESDAIAAKEDLDRQFRKQAGITTKQSIAKYKEHLGKKRNERSVATATYRLNAFFEHAMSKPLATVTKADIAKGIAGQAACTDDTKLNVAAEARTFLRWCQRQGYTKTDLAAEVQVEGRRNRHGKAQLRIDESRRWLAVVLEEANKGQAVAVAAAMTLLMGMRASEIVGRVARDVDDSGRLLWIPEAKTRAGVRRLQVPAVLQPYLAALAKDKPADARLFGDLTRYGLAYHVERYCRAASVPTVCAHSMRGLHSTLATAAGVTGHTVAAALGHTSFEGVTARFYADPSTVAAATQARAVDELLGNSTTVPQQEAAEGRPA